MTYETNATEVGTPTQVVVGLFDNANDAHQAINQLRGNGFSLQSNWSRLSRTVA